MDEPQGAAAIEATRTDPERAPASGTGADPLRLWVALARAYGTVHREVAHNVADYDLTTAQFGVLEALSHLGPLTLGDLADKLLVTGGNVTYVMDRLQREGLVTRRRCSNDRRVVWAELTEDGRQLIAQVFPSHARFIEELMGVLAPDERAQLRTLLKKLGKGIQGDGTASE